MSKIKDQRCTLTLKIRRCQDRSLTSSPYLKNLIRDHCPRNLDGAEVDAMGTALMLCFFEFDQHENFADITRTSPEFKTLVKKVTGILGLDSEGSSNGVITQKVENLYWQKVSETSHLHDSTRLNSETSPGCWCAVCIRMRHGETSV